MLFRNIYIINDINYTSIISDITFYYLKKIYNNNNNNFINVNNISNIKEVKLNDIIVLNNISNTDCIKECINILENTQCKSYYFIFDNIITDINNTSVLFSKVNEIILSSSYLYSLINNSINISLYNYSIIEPIDIKNNITYYNKTTIQDNNINILMVLNKECDIENYKILINNNINITYHLLLYYKEIDDYIYNIIEDLSKINNIKIHVFKKLKHIYNIIQSNNINIYLSIQYIPNIYDYILTTAINSGLAIIYNYNFNNQITSNYNIINLNMNTFDINILNSAIINSINILKSSKVLSDNIERYLFIDNKYDYIFSLNIDLYLENIYNKNKNIYNNIFKKVEPFCIYFPQFHEVIENNYNFYKGFTDYKNLTKAYKNINSLLVPNKSIFGYYNLKYNNNIIKKQISTAYSYGIRGFAMYYYWFTHNTLSNKNTIFEDVINKMFDTLNEMNINFEIFLIWANENWSNNIHFNNSTNSHQIQNNYNINDLQNNIDKLVSYFKYNCYKKIDNKPVLFLHQPYECTIDNINILYRLLEKTCINNGFDGVHLVLNNTLVQINDYPKYIIHPNYKNLISTNQNKVLNYKNYFEQLKLHKLPNYYYNNNHIRGIVINYNNTVRLYTHKHNKNAITTTINNNFRDLLEYQLNFYKNTEKSLLNNIFLINAWNEWGEQMAIEPNNTNMFEYLETIQRELFKLVL